MLRATKFTRRCLGIETAAQDVERQRERECVFFHVIFFPGAKRITKKSNKKQTKNERAHTKKRLWNR